MIVCAAWSADSITLFLDNLEVQNRVELMVLKTAPRKALLPTSSTFDSEAARAACEDEMRARTLRYAPRPQKGKRSLSLAEDKQRLEGMLRALGEDISQIQAGASYRVGDLRGKLRQLVVAGGKHYQPALFRVAARLRAPLPVCDVGDASVRESRKSPALLRISGLRMGTQLFESAELLDFETWMRRRIVVAIDGTGRNAADLIMSASENVEGAHAGPNVPLDVDRLEQHSSGGITALTSLFLRIAAVTTELGNFVLAWPEPHPNES